MQIVAVIVQAPPATNVEKCGRSMDQYFALRAGAGREGYRRMVRSGCGPTDATAQRENPCTMISATPVMDSRRFAKIVMVAINSP